MHLDTATFLKVIETTPLVSVDLIIRNQRDEVLLGKRTNRPAQGFWFVPGGRIRKGERINDALRRISGAEVGFEIDAARLLGVFDHIYEDNFAGAPAISTQYVVLAFEHRLPPNTALRPDAQHSDLRWWTIEELFESSEVHEYTKGHFRGRAV